MAIKTTTQSHGTNNKKRELPAELKAIVFDVDGTFYHLEGIRKVLWFHFLRRFWHQPIKMRQVILAVRSYALAPESLRSSPPRGANLEEAHLEYAVKVCGLPREFVLESARQWLAEEPFRFISSYRYEGVHGVLSELQNKGLYLGVFSDYPPEGKLRAMGIENFFEVAVSAQDPAVQRFKPDPLEYKSH